MLQRTCTLVSSAVMLSMVGAFGKEQSGQIPTWPFDTHSCVDYFNAHVSASTLCGSRFRVRLCHYLKRAIAIDVPHRNVLGTIAEPQAYNATWGLCIGLAAVNCMICFLVPIDYSSYGKGYTKLDNEQVAIEEEEKEGLMSPSPHADSDSDEEGGGNKVRTSI